MKKLIVQISVFWGMVLTLCFTAKLSVKAYTTGELRTENGVEYLYSNGQKVINDFVFDGAYTYYAQADGTPMKNRLTYHPNGEHIIYFDEKGHEVFDAFQYCESVGYTCYFDSQGYIYKDQITFRMTDRGEAVYYLNANGKMEDSGWFQFANGRDYGFANTNGVINSDGFGYDPWGRIVYYHWNGMVARGLITDGNNYYSLDEADGHYLGQFSAGNLNPLYGKNKYIVGVNIPAGEYFLGGGGVEALLLDQAGRVVMENGSAQNLIFTVSDGQILYIKAGIATADLASQTVDISQMRRGFDAKIGVHLQPGVYRITGCGTYSGNAFYELWNDSTFLNGMSIGYRFHYTGESVNIRVSSGQMLRVVNGYATYIGG